MYNNIKYVLAAFCTIFFFNETNASLLPILMGGGSGGSSQGVDLAIHLKPDATNFSEMSMNQKLLSVCKMNKTAINDSSEYKKIFHLYNGRILEFVIKFLPYSSKTKNHKLFIQNKSILEVLDKTVNYQDFSDVFPSLLKSFFKDNIIDENDSEDSTENDSEDDINDNEDENDSEEENEYKEDNDNAEEQTNKVRKTQEIKALINNNINLNRTLIYGTKKILNEKSNNNPRAGLISFSIKNYTKEITNKMDTDDDNGIPSLRKKRSREWAVSTENMPSPIKVKLNNGSKKPATQNPEIFSVDSNGNKITKIYESLTDLFNDIENEVTSFLYHNYIRPHLEESPNLKHIYT